MVILPGFTALLPDLWQAMSPDDYAKIAPSRAEGDIQAVNKSVRARINPLIV